MLPSKILASLSIIALLAGCQSVFWKDLSGNGNQVILEQAAVAAGVAAVVKGDPARAATVKAIANAVLAADTGSTTTLASVEATLNAQIAALKLPPADAALAAALNAALQQAVNDQLSVAAGKIPPTVQIAIANVAKMVIADVGG